MAKIGVSAAVNKVIVEAYKAGTRRFPLIATAVREKTGEKVGFSMIAKVLAKVRKVKPVVQRKRGPGRPKSSGKRGPGRPKGSGKRGPGRPKNSGHEANFLLILPARAGGKVVKLATAAEVKVQISRFALKGGDPGAALVYARRPVKIARTVEVSL
ncbi:MAG: hypothetical protein AAB215_08985 [Planctomycetota bacterium]